ncbi:hypothetical protein AWV79_06035 [Cupriavidus sp. UYMMa02A]|nr:hypothetical protein AWV79_06035 [Cupriavidus sp. UYMMa02A]
MRAQLNGADSVSSLDLQVDSIESVRAFQVLCNIAAANSSRSHLLRSHAKSMSSGFTTVHIDDDEDSSQGITHLPFAIEKTAKTSGGGK